MRLTFLSLTVCLVTVAGMAQDRSLVTGKQAWKAKSSFEFPLGGNSIGLGGSSFGDQPLGQIGVLEQVSLTCVAPSDVLVQNLSLQIIEDDTAYQYELDFRERPPAPNGLKTIVVSQTVKIRVRFGFGGFGMGFNVWNGRPNASMRCTAILSGYSQSRDFAYGPANERLQ